MKKLLAQGVLAFALLAVISIPLTSSAFWQNFTSSISIGAVSSFETGGQVLGAVSGLTESQIQAILSLLLSFGAEPSIISNVEFSLRGTTVPYTPPPTSSSTSTALTAGVYVDSPAYAIAAGGSTNVPLGSFKFYATGENILLKSIRFYLNPSGKPSDLVKITVWDGSSKVGEGYYFGNSYGTVVTLTSSVVVPKDGGKVLNVKADLANIGTGYPGTPGDLIQIGMQFGFGDFYGVGVTSGKTIQADGSNASTAGIRLMKSFPTVSLDSLPTSGLEDGRLMRFKVTADSHGAVSFGQFGFSLNASPNITGGQVDLYAYTDANYSSPVSGFFASGAIGTAQVYGNGGYTRVRLNQPLEIPAGATRYFELRDSMKDPGVVNGKTSVTTTLLGETGYQGLSVYDDGYANGPLWAWSPNSYTTSSFGTKDWTNAYGLAGLPLAGLSQTRTGGGSTGSPSVSLTGPLSGTSFARNADMPISWNVSKAPHKMLVVGEVKLITASQPPQGSVSGGTFQREIPAGASSDTFMWKWGLNDSVAGTYSVQLWLQDCLNDNCALNPNYPNGPATQIYTYSSVSNVTIQRDGGVAQSGTITGGTFTTATPTLSGTAYNTGTVGIAIGNGDKAYGSGTINVSNNKWSHTVSSPLANGTYTVTLYGSQSNVLGTAQITIQTQVSTAGPKYNAMSCSSPRATGLGTGSLACYGLWDYGNEFGNDQNMCDSSAYSTPSTGCKISTSACSSGKATATRYYNISSGSVSTSDIQTIASNLLSTPDIVRAQLVRVWDYTCDAPTTTTTLKTPTVSLSASPTSVSSGSKVVLSWSSTNATRCVGWIGTTQITNLPKSGTYNDYPSTSKTYKVWCTNEDGSGKDGPAAEKSVSVTVASLPDYKVPSYLEP